jgi:hypothetical protein
MWAPAGMLVGGDHRARLVHDGGASAGGGPPSCSTTTVPTSLVALVGLALHGHPLEDVLGSSTRPAFSVRMEML